MGGLVPLAGCPGGTALALPDPAELPCCLEVAGGVSEPEVLTLVVVGVVEVQPRAQGS